MTLDRLQMSRIVGNILGNSLKYRTAALGHELITLSRAGAGKVELAFTDDGPGVPEAALTQIFESFYRTDKARTNPAMGSGPAWMSSSSWSKGCTERSARKMWIPTV